MRQLERAVRPRRGILLEAPVQQRIPGPIEARDQAGNGLEAANRQLPGRSEEHTSELQSQSNLVCRLLLEKKKRLMRWQPASTSVKAVTAPFSSNILVMPSFRLSSATIIAYSLVFITDL